MIREYAAEVIRRIDEDITTKQTQVGDGKCASFEDYKNVCGQIRGLMLARDHIEATLRNIEEEDA